MTGKGEQEWVSVKIDAATMRDCVKKYKRAIKEWDLGVSRSCENDLQSAKSYYYEAMRQFYFILDDIGLKEELEKQS